MVIHLAQCGLDNQSASVARRLFFLLRHLSKFPWFKNDPTPPPPPSSSLSHQTYIPIPDEAVWRSDELFLVNLALERFGCMCLAVNNVHGSGNVVLWVWGDGFANQSDIWVQPVRSMRIGHRDLFLEYLNLFPHHFLYTNRSRICETCAILRNVQ